MLGERIAGSAGAASAAVSLARETGAALAWVPRRAGERGALDAGALAGLLPGGRPLTDAAARAEVAAAWGVDPADLPASAGLCGPDLLDAASRGDLAALVVAGVGLEDYPDPRLATEADRGDRLRRVPREPPLGRHGARRCRPARRGRDREGRHLPRLGGASASLRPGVPRCAHHVRRPGPRHDLGGDGAAGSRGRDLDPQRAGPAGPVDRRPCGCSRRCPRRSGRGHPARLVAPAPRLGRHAGGGAAPGRHRPTDGRPGVRDDGCRSRRDASRSPARPAR